MHYRLKKQFFTYLTIRKRACFLCLKPPPAADQCWLSLSETIHPPPPGSGLSGFWSLDPQGSAAWPDSLQLVGTGVCVLLLRTAVALCH